MVYFILVGEGVWGVNRIRDEVSRLGIRKVLGLDFFFVRGIIVFGLRYCSRVRLDRK